MTKSGRYKPTDMGEYPPSVKLDHHKVMRCLGEMPKRFTLDQFVVEWKKGRPSGSAALQVCNDVLEWLEARGEVEKDGMMHWRRLKTVNAR